MKFDLDTAWKDATALVSDNFSLLAVLSGVFYFVPYLAAVLWVPGLSELMMGQLTLGDPANEAKINAMLAEYWWAILLLGIIQGIGFLAMLALLRRRAKVTVGEAIQTGAKSVLSYLAASLLMGFAIGLIIAILVAIPSFLGSKGLVVVGVIAAFVVAFYLFTKFSITSPVIAIEEELNPIRALSRSWSLTKGNSIRLFFYYALLFIAYAVISALISMVFSLVFALGGAETQTFGQAFASALMNSVFAVIFAAVMAAVHAQLSRLNAPPAQKIEGEY